MADKAAASSSSTMGGTDPGWRTMSAITGWKSVRRHPGYLAVTDCHLPHPVLRAPFENMSVQGTRVGHEPGAGGESCIGQQTDVVVAIDCDDDATDAPGARPVA